MMKLEPDVRRGAGALRFLLLFLCGWVALRVMMLWHSDVSFAPDAAGASWTPPSLFVMSDPDNLSVSARVEGKAPRRRDALSRERGSAVLQVSPAVAVGRSVSHGKALPEPVIGLVPESIAATAPIGPYQRLGQPAALARSTSGAIGPYWMQRSLAGWSLGSWVYLREGSGGATRAIGSASQLGGSQAGVRLSYGFGGDGRLRGYGRATVAIERPRQRELAVGLALAPVRHWPIDVAVEQRIAIGSEGRTALAVMATGGVSDVVLPAGLRLGAHAQAGVVGTRRRDGFADGAAVIDHRFGLDERAPFRVGALVAAAVQPGAARVDVGPRLTLRLPELGKGSRVALDWRQRIAGDARPESGVALTLAADF